jgi:hypothetical protein
MPREDREPKGRRATAAKGRPGSKNYERARPGTGIYAVRASNPSYKGTKDFDYKGKLKKGDKFVAGANILDAKGKVDKRKSFSDYLKSTGNRADDPRNWEFHYKAPSQAFSTQGKNDRRVDNRARARGRAEKSARREGKSVYEVQKIEYETQGIKQDTRATGLKAKAMGGASAFGSTRVASNVAAQRQKGQRRQGRAAARGPTTGAIA